MPENAYRDQNSVPTLIASSNVDGFTPVRLWADPITHRLLVDTGGASSGGYQLPTGTVNGSNQTFTFTTAPSAIVVDGLTINKVQSDGTVNWTGTTVVILAVAPNFNIFGIA